MLIVPGFNEEMNRCRSMVTMQAQALAQIGIGTLVIDLHGTGESTGDYVDGRWDVWLDDIQHAAQWLDGKAGGCVALLGIRLGVPLALSALKTGKMSRALVAWQPVVDGKSYFTQFMRMKIAANMDRTDIPKETTNGMRAQLSAGSSIEIAGYEIHPELGLVLDGLKLAELLPPEASRIVWLERSGGPESSFSPASTAVIESWQAAGTKADVVLFDGPAFWTLHERFIAPDLISKTTEWLHQLKQVK